MSDEGEKGAMKSESYAFVRGADYASTVTTSEKVAWTVDEIFGDRLSARQATWPARVDP